MKLLSKNTNELSNTERKYSRTRLLYIIEAALEYFFSLLLTGAYIAKVASAIGMSDATVGILTQMSSLGCVFQLCALFISGKKQVKHFVLISHTINQLFFSAVWLIPVFDLPKDLKAPLFIVALLGGWMIHHVINAPKISWYMSMVDDRKRGSFTAKKEMFSLVSGMVFTLTMSYVIDSLEANGELRQAFLVGGITMLVITLLHSLTLIFSHEPSKNDESDKETKNTKNSIIKLLKNKSLDRLLVLSALAGVINSCAMPFFGTYQNNELGFSLVFISVIGIIHVIVRCAAAIFMGLYADRRSFLSMLNLSYVFGLLSYVITIFTIPSNGKLMYTLFYTVFFAIFQAGYGNGIMNLVFDTVDPYHRTGAWALHNVVSGLVGFFTTIVCSFILNAIQQNGNKVFGIKLYAQQFLSVITVLFIIFIIVYINLFLKKNKSKK